MVDKDDRSDLPRLPVMQSFFGFWAVLAVGVSFGVVLGLVAGRWAPLRAVDRAVAEAANEAVSGVGWLVSALHVLTDLGGSGAAWLIMSVTTVWLLVRRLPRLALYVAVTGLGAAVLSPGIKMLVGRVRPVVDVVVATAPGASFPSGHALGSTVAYGVLLLVFLPVVPPRLRRGAVAAVVLLVAAIGGTRVALGVHYLSDVVGGWLLGVLWLAVTAAAFHPLTSPERQGEPPAGRPPVEWDARRPAPAHEAVLPAGWHRVALLLVAGVLLWGALVGVGLLITEQLPAVRQLDSTLVLWFASIRTEALDTLAVLVGHLGGTAGITILVLVAAPLLLAATRRWRPAVFLIVAVVGETALFLATSTIVSRTRPAVEHLSGTLPPTSSYPSGHAAATAAAYGALAVLAWAWTRGWPRYTVITVAVLATVGVALSRIYRGVHHPTDTVASVLYAAAWVAACYWALQPRPPDRPEDGDASPPAPPRQRVGAGGHG